MDVFVGTTALVTSAGAAGVFYFQPHRVIAALARTYPRIVWCLGAKVETRTSGTNASSNSSNSRAHSSVHSRTSSAPLSRSSETGADAIDDSNVEDDAHQHLNDIASTENEESLAWKEIKALYFASTKSFATAAKSAGERASDFVSRTVQTYRPIVNAGFPFPALSLSFPLSFSSSSASSSTLSHAAAISALEDGARVSLELDAGSPTPDNDNNNDNNQNDSNNLEISNTHQISAPIPGVSASLTAITIDDAPSQHTSEILDILKENNAKATFFIIGSHVEKLENGPEILARMVAEGHELANHTWYDRPTIRLPPAEFERELVDVDTMLKNYQPSPAIKWYRPGSGVFTQEMLDIAESYGYRTVLGCRFPVDTTSRDPKLNSWHVMSGMHPGAIVVLHDCREWILETLRILLPALSKKEYQSVTLSNLYNIASVGGIYPISVTSVDSPHLVNSQFDCNHQIIHEQDESLEIIIDTNQSEIDPQLSDSGAITQVSVSIVGNPWH
ncbi:hypothetical protein HK100_009732 [Physocladia obscura]|uniref:NodB homology domain-containing protein n=1 Tax=Physocladia obscura TaxID=109957 RepID=A0AAD5T9T5_9FUNG|nr:hypothetical protein HK100_009732 [Physocladia obscura]